MAANVVIERNRNAQNEGSRLTPRLIDPKLRRCVKLFVALRTLPMDSPDVPTCLTHRTPGLGFRALSLLILLLLGDAVKAEDHGQLGPMSPEVKAWAGTLENKLNQECCASADGWKPEEIEYDIAGGRYRVRIDGEWYDVPREAVLEVPNKFGFPVVWYYRTWDNGVSASVQIRCFIPGAGG
jgi:hypothetical protein